MIFTVKTNNQSKIKIFYRHAKPMLKDKFIKGFNEGL